MYALKPCLFTAAFTLTCHGVSRGQDAPSTAAPSTSPEPVVVEESPDAPPRGTYGLIDDGYDDEPPLDMLERQWRYRTRTFRPQRFSRRDLRRQYGYEPPYGVWGGYGRGFGRFGYATPGLWGDDEAYLQGRHDERRFAQWQQHHDKNRAAYQAAMTEGVRLFQETDYAEALMAFIRAARLNQGDPASRLHATYAMVAVGNYEDAALLLRRALQLQPRVFYLPLSIRGEYGVDIDFEAHFRRLNDYVQEHPGDASLLTLAGYYHYFSGDRRQAHALLSTARQIAPADDLIEEFHKAARLLTPSPREAPTAD